MGDVYDFMRFSLFSGLNREGAKDARVFLFSRSERSEKEPCPTSSISEKKQRGQTLKRNNGVRPSFLTHSLFFWKTLACRTRLI